MAEEEEEAAQGSPSPAPRSWRSRREPVDGKLQKAMSQTSGRRATKPVGLGREDTGSSVESVSSPVRRSDVSESDFDDKLRRHGLDQAKTEEAGQRGSRIFSKSKSRLGNRISETAKELVRKTSRNSLEGDSPSRTKISGGSNSWLSRRLSSRRSESDQSLSKSAASLEQSPGLGNETFPPGTGSADRPATVPPDYHVPEKSFAWQADADFTAGDLQVSTSPPIATGRRNHRIDEIRALEAEVEQHFTASQASTRNTRIDEIRSLESKLAQDIGDGPIDSGDGGIDRSERGEERGDKSHHTWQVDSPTARRDELRAREIEVLSRRALATARLDEIRERHANIQSRSPSPELVRKPSKEPIRSLSPDANNAARVENRVGDIAKETTQRLIDEAVVLDNPNHNRLPPDQDMDEVDIKAISEDIPSCRQATEARRDSRDLLRRLALAANTSPAADQRPNVDGGSARDRPGRDTARQRRTDGAKVDARPTVGFAGLHRESSVESLSDKRSNFAHSDSDPTERIEGEMKLFAPLENYSEKGSLRAPSPLSSPSPELDGGEEAGDVEETPKPTKPDPVTQPTPRVVGAFVETPVTVKVGKSAAAPVTLAPELCSLARGVKGVGSTTGTSCLEQSTQENGTATNARGRKSGTLSQKRPSSLPGRRRSKSLPRARSPLFNSARPPTVKDDLLEITKANHVDDSTLEDLAGLLDSHESRKATLTRQAIKSEPGPEGFSERQRELEAYDRMSKSLATGLLGIRTAKQGIERLEDKISHVRVKDEAPDTSHPTHPATEHTCSACQKRPLRSEGSPFTYIPLPFPRLWYKHPRFRLTLAGILLFILSLWYIAESSMCALYCKPQLCYPSQPCDWSPDDPQWGYAIPIKIDQWLAGGHGSAFTNHARPKLSDWLADVWDAATGTDITQVDTSRYSREQKRQHRRRLLRRGLATSTVIRPENKDKFEAWSIARVARERASGAREMGYTMVEEESMAGDEKI